MSLFKCKMCGGTLEIAAGITVMECEYCGTQQTLPKLDDEKRANMYDRANHFRRNNEFDKAIGIYENILNEDSTDAEVYWSLVLCRYGIEYVEEPSTHKRIPTVNRAQFTSIFDDDNYKSALQYADSYQRVIYENEAKVINEIQKGILAISQKEEPFDVFICYKETDNNGRRTPDSVLANDLYHQLTQEGFKVFFSRITLEDKLGSAYEPYIFAALNSAKVMVVLGTKPDYFKAVWVRNEWSRYLSLIKQGQKKILVPAYKDMDPYDLPEEFSHLQAQDMSKLGFMQDLIRGIKKIVTTDEPKANTVVKETIVNTVNTNTAPLLKRAFMFLEDGEWEKADDFCEQVLNQDPENAQAYVGKLMCELQVTKQENLKNQPEPFDNNNNYKKAMRFADDSLKTKLAGYTEYIKTRNENARLEGIYKKALEKMKFATLEVEFESAYYAFKDISHYKNSSQLADECMQKAESARKDEIYDEACEVLNDSHKWTGKNNDIKVHKEAIEKFQSLNGWRDSDEKIILCQKRIEEIEAKAEADRIEKERLAEISRAKAEKRAKQIKKTAIITTPIICAVIAFIIVLNTVIIPNVKYNNAIEMMDAGKYTDAISAFEALEGYKDSVNKIEECNVNIYGEEVWNKVKSVNIGDTYRFGSYEQDNNKSNGQEDIEWLVLAKEGTKILVISKEALDCKLYNTSYTKVTWETCTLRKWLNNDFLDSAFSANEKAMIPTVTVSADKNPDYSTNPGNATQDQVFLLSITEVNKYFSSDSARRCKATDYAVSGVAYVNSSNGNCWWWLRSPGHSLNMAAGVYNVGDVYEHGYAVNYDRSAVRPALWIDLGQ